MPTRSSWRKKVLTLTEREPLQPLSASQREALEEATTTYQQAISPAVAGYLLGRGISREAAVSFRLGVVTEPHPGHGRFRGFLSIPYLGRDQQALSLRFRCMVDHIHREYGHGKYMSMLDEPARVFNVRAIHEAGDTIHVAEGELDAVILNQLGLPAIAIPGAEAWRNHHRRMLAGFNQVWVWGDPDDAGADFTNRVCRSLRSAKGVHLKRGDVTDSFLQGGAEAVLSLVDEEAA